MDRGGKLYVDRYALKDLMDGQKVSFSALADAIKLRVVPRNRCDTGSCGTSSSLPSCEAGISCGCGAKMVGVIWRRKAFLVEHTTSTFPCCKSSSIRASNRSIANVKSATVLLIYDSMSGDILSRSSVALGQRGLRESPMIKGAIEYVVVSLEAVQLIMEALLSVLQKVERRTYENTHLGLL